MQMTLHLTGRAHDLPSRLLHDPNEAYEVVQRPAWLNSPPTDWWTVLANGIPVRHYPPHRKHLAIQYATDPAYPALLVRASFGSAAPAAGSERKLRGLKEAVN